MVTVVRKASFLCWEWTILAGEYGLAYGHGWAWTKRGAIHAADSAELRYWLSLGTK